MSQQKPLQQTNLWKPLHLLVCGVACLGWLGLSVGEAQAHRAPSKQPRTTHSTKAAQKTERPSDLFFTGAAEDTDKRGGALCAGTQHVAWVPRVKHDGAFRAEVRWIGLRGAKQPILRRRLRLAKRPRMVRCLADGIALRVGRRWMRVSLQSQQRSSLRVDTLLGKVQGKRPKALLQRVESGLLSQELRFFQSVQQGWRLLIQRRSVRVARGEGEIQHFTKVLLVNDASKPHARVLVYQGVLVESLDSLASL
ncbi:MAG: hypothetical protein H6728_16020 [Myxococcales bacterium]|nr:hypothetical protein [Myxococcales bacterium]MCB9644581.1 hypothetical protein [Myxococcales bacterium]